MNETDLKKKAPRNLAAELYDWAETFLLALTAVITVFTLFFKFVTVDGTSMLQTLQNGDRLIITDVFYQPRSGDIVVLDVSYKDSAALPAEKRRLLQEPLIKRVIAVEGQTVDIDPLTWEVSVDGAVLEEGYVNYDYINGGSGATVPMHLYDIAFPVTVDEGCVFVMGDNRNYSADSRYSLIGQIDRRYILGRVVVRLFPLSSAGGVR